MLRVPWAVRARLAVTAPRRFRKATKIFLEGIPPLNKEKSKGSMGKPAHHPCRSLAMPGAACGLTAVCFHCSSRLLAAPALLAPWPWCKALLQHHISREFFLQHALYLFSFSRLFLRVLVGRATVPCPRRWYQAAAGRGAGSSCGLTCAPSPGGSWDCRRRESRRRNLALTDSQHFCVALFQRQSYG